MVSQPQVVAEAILTALAAAPRRRNYALIGEDNARALVYVGYSTRTKARKLGVCPVRR